MSLLSKTLPATAVLLVLTANAVFSSPKNAPAKRGYDGYALVRTRNIFDPERQPGVATPEASQKQDPQPSRSDFAALTGTMITPEKTLAFFSGSRSDYCKVIAVNGTIAGAVLVKINSSNIEVEREGKRIVIAVGQTVPLDATSAPSAAPSAALSSTPPSSSTAASSASPSSATGSDREALLRRMMEKRQQELK